MFRRGIGEASEVVGKEMYEFEDRGGRRLALRPEGTAPVVRAFVQHHPPLPFKAWYVTPSFRYERPQAGRYRQHHQVGVEALGPTDADLDVEVISLADGFFRSLGLRQFTLSINSMGDDTCRPTYVELLAGMLAERQDELCDEHAERWVLNPLRVLDCKSAACQAVTAQAPALVDHLCEPCAAHFARVRQGLESLGVPYVLDHRLVRGFDYYTRTTFEFAAGSLNAAQNAIGGGGRYDRLVEMLGGPPTPGIGFGIGIERALLACDGEGVFAPDPPALDAFVVDVTGGEAARDLTAELRRAGLRADRAYDSRSMRSQLRSADRSGARLALIVGAEELATARSACDHCAVMATRRRSLETRWWRPCPHSPGRQARRDMMSPQHHANAPGGPAGTSLRTSSAAASPDDVGPGSRLCGWVARRREHGEHLAFVDLRDYSGVVQCVVDGAVDVRSEYVIAVEGMVRLRPEGTVNPSWPRASRARRLHGRGAPGRRAAAVLGRRTGRGRRARSAAVPLRRPAPSPHAVQPPPAGRGQRGHPGGHGAPGVLRGGDAPAVGPDTRGGARVRRAQPAAPGSLLRAAPEPPAGQAAADGRRA